MSVVVHEADLRADREQLIALLSECLSPTADARRFEWLYLQNPYGKARVWIARDTATERAIGASALFPRGMKADGRNINACIFGDFCIHRDYRTLGPALILQRATIAGMNAAGFEFGYDLPSVSMLGVYRRLNIAPAESLVRMAKPLRANRKVSERVKSPSVARAASAAANLLLATRDALRRSSSGAEIAEFTGRFGAEFTALAEAAGKSGGGHVHRTAEYLNWRYLDHPQRRFEILTAREGGNLKGFLIFLEEEGNGRVVDWFSGDWFSGDSSCEGGPEIRHGLVAHAIGVLRARNCETLSLPISAAHPWGAELQDLGFRARESQPIVLMENQAAAAPKHSWLFLEGDRES